MTITLTQDEIVDLAAASPPTVEAIIDGRLVGAASGKRRPAASPIDGAMLAEIADCDAGDVDRAVAGARRAFADRRWAGMAPKERKRRMLRWAELVEAEGPGLAVLETRDMGMPIGMASGMEIPFAIDSLRWYAEVADKLYDEVAVIDDSVTALITRAPLGVVAAVLPWNAPAMIAAWKLGPALVTGNSVVVKPSEDASLVVLRLGALALEAGIPEGVVQVVTGDGAAGAALARHGDVDCITFTGSGGTGRRLLVAAAESNMKRVSLELGGKSANIVMADAPDLGMAADVSVGFAFANQGQVCEAPTRLLVQNAIREEFVAEVVARAAGKRVGNPLELGSDLGPIVNRRQYDSILAKIARAEADGADLVLDGRRTPVPDGLYLAPTVAIANDTRYGLAAMVWSADIDAVLHAGRHLVAGVIHVNGGAGPLVELPHGGFRESGSGRDRSLHAIDKYADLKTMILRSRRRG